MFQGLRNVWRESVLNFREELSGADSRVDTGGPGVPAHPLLREARLDLHELARMIERVAAEAEQEEAGATQCRRIAESALEIGDERTRSMALEIGESHERLSGILRRKEAILREEWEARARDLERMGAWMEE